MAKLMRAKRLMLIPSDCATEQQASSAARLHLPHRRVLQRRQERHGQHRLPGAQDPAGPPAKVRTQIHTRTDAHTGAHS